MKIEVNNKLFTQFTTGLQYSKMHHNMYVFIENIDSITDLKEDETSILSKCQIKATSGAEFGMIDETPW